LLAKEQTFAWGDVATWPGRERRKRPNLNRWEDNDERQKIPRTTSHRTPSHPIQSRPPVAARSRRAGAPRGSGRPLGCTTGSWSFRPDGCGESTNLDKPPDGDRPNPTYPNRPRLRPPLLVVCPHRNHGLVGNLHIYIYIIYMYIYTCEYIYICIYIYGTIEKGHFILGG
jgi:hypothetical protein